MKTSEAWTEEVSFVDCPECSETIELGSGVIFGDALEIECPKCAECFKVEVPQ